jgi:hypothetical protein
MSIAPDHAAGLHQRQDEVACGDVTAAAHSMQFPQYEMADEEGRKMEIKENNEKGWFTAQAA